ncbi:MAG: porphobilinogen synthase [Candidatus Latescibacteria bacterium]|nr:porphobilinogen synthase [Candidatus Latescibacterota bacterium]
MGFPVTRLRRLRRTPQLRTMVRETSLSPDDFILPYFVRNGTGISREISSMPGVSQMSIDVLVENGKAALSEGIRAIMLFGIPDYKDATGTGAYDENGIIPRAVRALKSECPDLVVVTDVCMCEYTDHGHCGIIKNGEVDNDPTLELLAKASLAYARAGADIIAPSDMMDGRIGVIRNVLDDNRYDHIPIMAYSAKFASGFYGPFRDAAESPPQFGDRRSYQMDPANRLEAMREIALDIEEGADIIMVKPAMPYLDIIREARNQYCLPLAAYQVSGEYAMIHAAARNGWLDFDTVMMESLIAIKRAGADMILTYFARTAARKLA